MDDENGDDRAVLCIRCGYDLRGLPAQHRCPECGVPIERSIHGQRLDYADPRWLAQVFRGVRRLHQLSFATVFLILPIAAAFAGSLLFSLFAGLGYLLFLLPLAEGVFRLTAPEPRLARVEDRRARRRVVRTAALACIPIPVVAECLALSISEVPGAAPAAQLIRTGGYGLLVVALVVTVSEGFAHLASLALRIPDTRLADRSRALVARIRWWGLPVVVVILVPPITDALDISVARGPIMLISSCACLVLAVGFIWHLATGMDVLAKQEKALWTALGRASLGDPDGERVLTSAKKRSWF